MSEGRSTPTPIQLLILSDSRDQTENIEASLRNGGLAVHCTRISDLDGLEETLQSQSGDLLLCSTTDPAIDLRRLLEQVRAQKQDLPVLILSDPGTNPPELLQAMREGARDLVDKDDFERLQLVVAREIGDLQRRRELAALRQRLLESEQRCLDLIEGSREAIAFFQDGMHVYVNPAYLRLFGFQDRAEVEDLPLLDIVDKPYHKVLRAALKELEMNHEHGSVSLSATCRHQNGSTMPLDLFISKTDMEGEPSLRLIIRNNGSTSLEEKQGLLNEAHARTTGGEDSSSGNQLVPPPPPQEMNDENSKILRLLTTALSQDQFCLVYQPIISLQGDTRENYAVMVRMLDEQEGELLPEVFFNVAKRHGKMVELDRWIIRHAIAALSEHRKQGRKINFFIILSDTSILDKNLLLWICDCLRDYEARGGWLTFQIREQCARDNLGAVTRLFDGLKKIKCQIALDRFGLLPHPETLLNQLDVDYVKLAPGFVQEINSSQQKQDELHALNEMLVHHKVKAIATGVENANSLAVLWTAGIAYIQGYFLQEPSPVIEYGTHQHLA
jgi:PAS domain S-box-containing protein